MGGITNPAEEYFKNGLWGWVTDQWKKLVATAGGALHIQFAGQEADVEVKQTAPADLTPGVCGWDGSAWQKLSLVWGFSDRWSQWLGETKDGDGQFSKSSTAVPAGYIYVIQAAYIKNETGARGAAYFRAYDGGIYHPVVGTLAPAINEITTLYGPFVLKEGDLINLAQDLCLNNDEIVAGVWGYKMKVAE